MSMILQGIGLVVVVYLIWQGVKSLVAKNQTHEQLPHFINERTIDQPSDKD